MLNDQRVKKIVDNLSVKIKSESQIEFSFLNTLSHKKEKFVSISEKKDEGKKVTMYTCGPTVYHKAHLGNLMGYVYWGFLRNFLEKLSYEVNHQLNLTDVGHLKGDGDVGEDKMEIARKRDRKTSWQVAEYYTQLFMADYQALNIPQPTKFPKATDYIAEQIELIKKLDEKSFTYEIEGNGLYFDFLAADKAGLLTNYRKMLGDKRIEATLRGDTKHRLSAKDVEDKKTALDFCLWRYHDGEREMKWDSPWGEGIPGWHSECIAMIYEELAETIDIHGGGEDHITAHHPPEIAQSECAYGKPLANYWIHNKFLTLKDEKTGESVKMAKSTGVNGTLDQVLERGFSGEDLRYYFLAKGKYNTEKMFDWDDLKLYQKELQDLKKQVIKIKNEIQKNEKVNDNKLIAKIQDFLKIIADDLEIPYFIVNLRKLLKGDDFNNLEKIVLTEYFNYLLRLDFSEEQIEASFSTEVLQLAAKRWQLKQQVKTGEIDKGAGFDQMDEIRDQLKVEGVIVRDEAIGYVLVDEKGREKIVNSFKF